MEYSPKLQTTEHDFLYYVFKTNILLNIWNATDFFLIQKIK